MKSFATANFSLKIKILLLIIFLSGGLIVYLRDTPIGFLFWSLIYVFIISGFCLFFLIAMRYFFSKFLWKRILSSLFGIGCLIALIVLTLTHFNLDFWNKELSELSDNEWLADYDYLTEQIRTHHPSQQAMNNRQDFDELAKMYRAGLPGQSVHEKIITFNRLIAELNDGHSSIWPGFEPIDSHSFPVQFYFFDDGLFIIDTDNDHKEFIGSKVIQIGTKSVDALYGSLRSITGSENEIGKKVRFTMYAVIAEVLVSEGAIDTLDELKLTVETEKGEQETITFKPISSSLWMYWAMINPKPKNTSPAFKNLRSDFYFFEYWPEHKTIYLQFNIVFDKMLLGESIEEFSQRLDTFAKENDFERFIIDLRNNNGGNNGLLAPLIDVIRDNEKINRSGKLFTLIGRHTFSAALNFAHALENQTKTLFVGESAGATPNFHGDTPNNTLPNSGIKLILSTLFWQNSIAEDPRTSIVPDIKTTYYHTDFLKNKDPAIDAILNYTPIKKPKITKSKAFPKLEGSYHFSNTKLLTIQRKSKTGQLNFTINDFMPWSFAKVSSDLHFVSEDSFRTDIHNVYLVNKNRRLFFDWFGVKKELRPIETDELNVINYIHAGVAEGNQRGFNFRAPTENDLNNWGEHFVGNHNLDIALNIFVYNVKKNPSSTSFLSLGKTYLAIGDKKQALLNLEKSLSLDPNNVPAIAVLNTIN